MNTDTPRTDAAIVNRMYAGGPDSEYIDPNFARDLERELALANSLISRLRAQAAADAVWLTRLREQLETALDLCQKNTPTI